MPLERKILSCGLKYSRVSRTPCKGYLIYDTLETGTIDANTTRYYLTEEDVAADAEGHFHPLFMDEQHARNELVDAVLAGWTRAQLVKPLVETAG